MISFRKIGAIYAKNMKNFISNPFMGAVPVMVLILAYLMGMIAPDEATPYQIVGMMLMILLMNLLMGGSFIMSCLIAEEKEKNTLNVLITSTVSVMDFLISNVLFTATITIAVNIIIYFITGLNVLPFGEYMLFTSLGTITAITFGASLGLLAKNQAAASAMSSPMMALIILPAFLHDNFFVENVLHYVFTEQIAIGLVSIARGYGVPWFRLGIIAANLAVFVVLFAVCYRKKGLEG